jgi:hypothetical protein
LINLRKTILLVFELAEISHSQDPKRTSAWHLYRLRGEATRPPSGVLV